MKPIRAVAQIGRASIRGRGGIAACGLLALVTCSRVSPEQQALCDAVAAGDTAAVRVAIASGAADLNADPQGSASDRRCQPFPIALDAVQPERLTNNAKQLDLVRLLLDLGADPKGCWRQAPLTATGASRGTGVLSCALSRAAATQSPALVRMLLERGADARTGAGAAALVEAATVGDLEMARMLVEAGAPLNEVAGTGRDPGSQGTALGAAVAGGFDELIEYLEAQPGAREFPEAGGPAAVGTLARAVGDPGRLTAGEQAFMVAARRGDTAAVTRALATGVAVNRIDDFGLSALMRAARHGRTDTVRALLAAGADPNLMHDGQTALHLAAARGHLGPMRALIDGKADVNARFSDTSVTPLFAAVQHSQDEAVRLLLSAGANRLVGDTSYTPLQYAVWRADTPVVTLLLDGDRASVNARHPESTDSALHMALGCRNADYNQALISALVTAGADLTARDQNGDNPLAAVQKKRAAEKLPYYQACYDAQIALLSRPGTTR